MIVQRRINGIDFAVNTEKPASLLCDQKIADATNGSIYLFADYLYKINNSYIPLITTWEITSICNFNCKFCYINSKKNNKKVYIPLDRAKNAIDELVEQGLLLVYLTGGEIFTHPNFREIYTYLKEKGVYVVLLTNLSLLNDELVKLFEKYPPFRITASLYGVSDKQFVNVTENLQIRAKTIQRNILMLKKIGINITVQTPINQLTFPEYEKIAKWCYDNKIVYKTSNELTDSYFGEDNQTMYIDEDVFKNAKNSIKFISDKNVVLLDERVDCKFGYKYHFDCIAGRHTYAISYNLHVRPCFNIWEKDSPWFDGSISMTTAIDQLKEYIGNKKKEKINFCNGCIGHSFCSECMMTQNKHNAKLKDYMDNVCKKNKKKATDYILFEDSKTQTSDNRCFEQHTKHIEEIL